MRMQNGYLIFYARLTELYNLEIKLHSSQNVRRYYNKYVISIVNSNRRIVSGDLEDFVKKIKEVPGVVPPPYPPL